MNTQQMVREAAKWMDGFKPRWYRDIDLSRFDIGWPNQCVLGQTFPGESYYELAQNAPESLRHVFLAGGDLPSDYFEDDSGNDIPWMQGMTEFWVQEIKYRCETE